MYLKMFGLQEKPFHITPNPRFVFLSKKHKEAFAHLLYGVRQRVGFMSLIGEVGTGKTTVLRTLLKQLEEADYQVALIFNPCLSALELLQSIHREFGIPYRDGEENFAILHDSLNRFLLEERQQGKTVVLVIDEAQNLDPSVLEQLRLLSNLETETDKLLQLIIVGQPELDDLLERHELRQLKQRLTVRYRLTNMDAEDTAAYVNHRLQVAGRKGEGLFSEKALRQIYRITNGLPRLINILCDRALLAAYSNDCAQVDHKIIAETQHELAGEKAFRPGRWSLLAALSLLAAMLFLLVYPQPDWLPNLFKQENVVAGTMLSASIVEKGADLSTVPTAEIDPRFLAQLKETIGAVGEVESALIASAAVLNLWGRPALESFNIDTYQPMETALRDIGMATIRFQNNPQRLLDFNTPAILSILLPNLAGKRYLALLQVKDGRMLTVPALTADGWLPLPYLEAIWFGKAVIPWSRFEQLPYIDNPGTEGNDVVRIQRLLALVGYPELEITGVYDTETILAVSDLQKKMGLSPDGRVGARTLLQIYRIAGREMPALTGEARQ
jgi:general secretion pathway protein A